MTVARHGQRRGESPINPRCQNFPRGNLSDSLQEIRVSRCTQADIMWKDCRLCDVIIAVYGIDSVDDGNGQMAIILFHGGGPVGVIHVNPVLHRVFPGAGATATEYRTDMPVFDFFGRNGHSLCLYHLADFLSQRHLAHEVIHPFSDTWVR